MDSLRNPDMKLLPSRFGSWLSWLGWSLFWLGFNYLGQMQAWVFGDHTNKPGLFDLIEPLHFWFPSVVFMTPVMPVDWLLARSGGPYWVLQAADVLWILALSRSIVFVQDRLHARQGPLITMGSIGVSAGTLVVLRTLAGKSPTDPSSEAVSVASSCFLLALVLATYVYVLVGVVVAGFRRGMTAAP
jgi:hypothetical protein